MPEISLEQEQAFEALNALQIRLQKQSLYSTFAGLQHDCFPSDTSFVVSRADLLMVLEILIAKYGKNMEVEQGYKFAAAAVLAQEEYLVEQCYDTSQELDNESSTRSGIWILPKVLDRRDVILVW